MKYEFYYLTGSKQVYTFSNDAEKHLFLAIHGKEVYGYKKIK